MSSERGQRTNGDTAIEVADLAKEFRFYERPSDRLKELLLLNRRRYHTIKRALSEVSFTVRHGEAVGVMGRNGAGKTTLLSILTGTMVPTSGTVDVYGNVGAILGLGVGFLPQYSGRENLRNGLIALGVPTGRIREKEREVVEFSELGSAIDDPLRTYSSGMAVRLGFALAVSGEPDILIVDEALAVGDAAFQHKCNARIRKFLDDGKTLFFVSHSTGILEATCGRGIVLDKGRVVCDGEIKEAIRQYRLRYFGDEAVVAASETARHWGDPNVELVRTEVIGSQPTGRGVFEIHQCDLVRLRLTIRVPDRIERPAIEVIVRGGLGREICGYNTAGASEPFPAIAPGEFSFEIRIPFRVPPGAYSVEVGISDIGGEKPRLVHIWEEVCVLKVVRSGYTIRGMIDPGIELVYGETTYCLHVEKG